LQPRQGSAPIDLGNGDRQTPSHGANRNNEKGNNQEGFEEKVRKFTPTRLRQKFSVETHYSSATAAQHGFIAATTQAHGLTPHSRATVKHGRRSAVTMPQGVQCPCSGALIGVVALVALNGFSRRRNSRSSPCGSRASASWSQRECTSARSGTASRDLHRVVSGVQLGITLTSLALVRS